MNWQGGLFRSRKIRHPQAGFVSTLARFQREAEVLAALSHPNIAAIYGLEKTLDFTPSATQSSDALRKRVPTFRARREHDFGRALCFDEHAPLVPETDRAGCG
jgi:hypothetical protein